MTTTSDEELFEEAIQEQVQVFRVRKEAERIVAAEQDEDISLEKYKQVSKKLTKTEWLIKGYLELGVVGFIAGAYQTGKSFLALDWAMSLATGLDWFDYRVPQKGNILYIAGEGYASVGKRLAAWSTGHGGAEPEDGGASFILKPIQFINENMVDKLTKVVVEHEIDLVVIDTLARSTIGLSENDSGDMGVFLNGCFKLRDARGELMTTVLIVHHFGKDARQGARGHSRLIADADFNYEVRAQTDVEGWVLHCDKLKEDGHPDDWAFTLKEIVVDADQDIHSCIIQPNDTGTIQARANFADAEGGGQGRGTTPDPGKVAKASGKRTVRHGKDKAAKVALLNKGLKALGTGATNEELADYCKVERHTIAAWKVYKLSLDGS